MIKARVVSLTINEAIGGVTKLDFETYIDDKDSVCLSSFLGAMPWEGLDVVMMTKEEYFDSVDDFVRKRDLLIDENEKLREENKKLKYENTELAAKNTDIRYDRTIINQDNTRLRRIVKEQSETIQKLEEENILIKKDIKDLKEKMAQELDQLSIQPDGTFVFKHKRVSELEKEVEKLKEENKALKNKDDEFSLKVTGGLFYYKED